MQWFRMTSPLLVGMFALVHALGIRGGDLEPIRLQTQKTPTLEGRWIVVSHAVDGDGQDTKGAKVQFAKGNFTLEEQNGEVQKCSYKADTSRVPNQIDFTPTDGTQKDQVFPGIFTLKGDRLTVCLARPGSDRPAETASTEGSGNILIVLDRAKSQRE